MGVTSRRAIPSTGIIGRRNYFYLHISDVIAASRMFLKLFLRPTDTIAKENFCMGRE